MSSFAVKLISLSVGVVTGAAAADGETALKGKLEAIVQGVSHKVARHMWKQHSRKQLGKQESKGKQSVSRISSKIAREISSFLPELTGSGSPNLNDVAEDLSSFYRREAASDSSEFLRVPSRHQVYDLSVALQHTVTSNKKERAVSSSIDFKGLGILLTLIYVEWSTGCKFNVQRCFLWLVFTESSSFSGYVPAVVSRLSDRSPYIIIATA